MMTRWTWMVLVKFEKAVVEAIAARFEDVVVSL